MSRSDSQKKADAKYRKNHIKRVPLDMKIDDYEQLQHAATAASEPVNTYIKKAIKMRMNSEKGAANK